MTDIFASYLKSKNWKVEATRQIPAKSGTTISPEDLPLSPESLAYLRGRYPQGIFQHQHDALRLLAEGRNVCLSTSTGSGKSMPFYAYAIHVLSRQPEARIIAIYPLKALGAEQAERWQEALLAAGIRGKVSRIDGSVLTAERPAILKSSRVVIMTPDVMHAWLLPNAGRREVRRFLESAALTVIDEVHQYTGVFGSNSAFLFRRLRHLMAMRGRRCQFIAASATIADAPAHLANLVGESFELVDSRRDSSPSHAVRITFLEPPRNEDSLGAIRDLLDHAAQSSNHRFIAFVNSRKMAEQLASMMNRQSREQTPGAARSQNPARHESPVESLGILPYRSGYEEQDRRNIQARLSEGSLKGVISTSALELGIDIPSLSLGFLVGVPASSTSLYQRMGRVGRHQDGEIFLIKGDDLNSESIFRNPDELFHIPPAQSALYLENQRIQYIHAMCLARHGGEHDQVLQEFDPADPAPFSSPIEWPEGFIELCLAERSGNLAPDMQAMKMEAGQGAHHAFPLRDVEAQFKVVHRSHGMEIKLGSLSHAQVMREAYPGAVYHYVTRPYRVVRIRYRERMVDVRQEPKNYHTQPVQIPTHILPNFHAATSGQSRAYGALTATEADLQVRESITGFRERRGSNEFTQSYPMPPDTGVFFSNSLFQRNYFTTGVLLSHPALDLPGVDLEALASLLFDSFLMVVPFEKADLQVAADKYRQSFAHFQEGRRFIAIHDQAYGSLRLSSHLLQNGTLRHVVAKAVELVDEGSASEIGGPTIAALREMAQALQSPPRDLPLEGDEIPIADTGGMEAPDQARYVRIIQPGSKGLHTRNGNQEFAVQSVFFHPAQGCLMYRGEPRAAYGQPASVSIIPVRHLAEIPGESRMGYYDLETGMVEALAAAGA